MLIRNGKPVNLDDPKTDLEKRVKKEIAELKEQSEFISIKNPSPFRYDDSNRAVQKPMKAFWTKTSIMKDGLPETWVYCERPKEKDGKHIYDPVLLQCTESIQIDPKLNSEAAYFLTKIMNVEKVGLYLEDKRRENKQISAKRKRQMDVGYMIYGDKLSESEVRTLALSWGVAKGDEDPIEMVQNSLYEIVEAGEKNIQQTQRGYEAFLKDADGMGEEVFLRALVGRAIDNGVIEFNERLSRWVYKGSQHSLASVPPMKLEIKETVLVQKLKEDNDVKATFMDTMEGNAGKLAEFDPKQYKLLNKTDLIKTAKVKHGIVLTEEMTKKVMLDEIEKRLSE